MPIIASDQVGAAADLVISGENGFIFPAGDVPALAELITRFAELPDAAKLKMGEKSFSLITEWTDRDLGAAMVEHLDKILEARI